MTWSVGTRNESVGTVEPSGTNDLEYRMTCNAGTGTGTIQVPEHGQCIYRNLNNTEHVAWT
jgi:hypothetical protein